MIRQTKRFCSRCILSASFPGITFDDTGVCNYCAKFRGNIATEEMRQKYAQKFTDLLARTENRTTSYDVLMAYSGGKDSTYTLDIFVHHYKLHVLALVFDNGFISAKAEVNIRTVCSNLGVDCIFVRPNQSMLHTIFREAAMRDLFSQKTLERASTICTSCIGLVKGITLRTALEKDIPFVGFGWSPGQAPIKSSVMKTNPNLMKCTQSALYRPLHNIVGDAINPYFLTDKQFAEPEKFPWNVHPLAFLEYNEKAILQRNAELGWEKPDDTDPNSSNCLLNSYANYVHRKKYGFHPYEWEIAGMVRSGIMERDEGLAKILPQENDKIVEFVMKKLSVL